MENGFALVMISIMFIAIIALVLLVITRVLAPNAQSDSDFVKKLTDSLELDNGWTKEIAAIGSRGKCSVYRTFTSNAKTVDTIAGRIIPTKPGEFDCLDGYNMTLRKLTRECGPGVDFCLGKDGSIYSPGEIESYYQRCGNFTECSSQASTIVFNLSINSDTILVDNQSNCMTGSLTNVGSCFADDILASVDRKPFPGTTTVDEVEAIRIRILNSDQCLKEVNGDVDIATCSTLPNQGYVWLFTPKVLLNDDTGTFVPSRILSIPDGKLPDINYSPKTSEELKKTLNDFLQLRGLVGVRGEGIKVRQLVTCNKSAKCTDQTSCSGIEEPEPCVTETTIVGALVWDILRD
jgi:hypothetical protein